MKEPELLVVAGTRARGGPYAGRLFEGLIYPEFARLRDSGAFGAVAARTGGKAEHPADEVATDIVGTVTRLPKRDVRRVGEPEKVSDRK